MDLAGRTLIFSGVRGDTRRYRTLHLYEQLRLAGVDCVLSHLTDPRLPELIPSVSIAILHRVAYDRYVARLLNRLRKQNALVILDADDFLYDPEVMRWINSPDFQDPVRAGLYRKELLRHRATLEHCDAITVSTDYLASLMAPFGMPVRVHRNAFNLEMLALSDAAMQGQARQDDRIVIGYASGTRTHDRDFAAIRPALQKIMEKHPRVELWLYGTIAPGQNWGKLQGRIRTFPLVPWRALPGRLAMLDINLAPLPPENPFNQSKSEIKYMEAALVRVPTVASGTDAFRYAIRPEENGFLAETPDEWCAILDRLVLDEALRRNVGAAAYQDVLHRYAPWVRGKQMLRTITDLAAQTGRSQVSVSLMIDEAEQFRYHFSPADEEHPTMRELAGYSIRHRGLDTLLGQIWVFFRRKLSPIFPFRSSESA